MKNLLHLKGKVISIDPDFAVVSEDKSEEEYKFYANDLKDFEINDKFDALIAPSFSESSPSKILSIKQIKKVKPIKMPNFNTLIGHMVKTKERLKATLEITENPTEASDLKEKIEYLEKGISLFR